MTFRLIALFILSGMYCAPSAASEKLKVVTSIRPLQLIANEIMADAGPARVLIGHNESPHHFQLKPSQLTTVSNSDLLIWVSNDFETSLGKLQQNLPTKSASLQLAELLPAANLIGDGADIDGHIWLSVENVKLITSIISEQLSTLDPNNKSLYTGNAWQLIDNVEKWRQQAAGKLGSLQPRYLLDHQFLQYFEKSFGLPATSSLRSSHDHGGGIRRISAIHGLLGNQTISCMLVSNLPASKQVQQLSQEHHLKIKLIDTLNQSKRYNSIIELLDAIVTTLQDCV